MRLRLGEPRCKLNIGSNLSGSKLSNARHPRLHAAFDSIWVNHSEMGAEAHRLSLCLPWSRRRRARLELARNSNSMAPCRRASAMASRRLASAPAASPTLRSKSPRSRSVSACSHLVCVISASCTASATHERASCGRPAIPWASPRSVRTCGTWSIPLVARTSANPAVISGMPWSG